MIETIGERVHQIRRTLKLSQAELARRCGCPTAVISNLENDKQDIFAKRLGMLALALNVSADYLLGLTDDPTPAPRRRTRRRIEPAPLSAEEREPLDVAEAAHAAQAHGCPHCGREGAHAPGCAGRETRVAVGG